MGRGLGKPGSWCNDWVYYGSTWDNSVDIDTLAVWSFVWPIGNWSFKVRVCLHCWCSRRLSESSLLLPLCSQYCLQSLDLVAAECNGTQGSDVCRELAWLRGDLSSFELLCKVQTSKWKPPFPKNKWVYKLYKVVFSNPGFFSLHIIALGGLAQNRGNAIRDDFCRWWRSWRGTSSNSPESTVDADVQPHTASSWFLTIMYA